MSGIRDSLRRWRNKLLADPKFHDFAATFPLTRPIARSRAAEIFDITAGFVYSQVLFACVELDIFEQLRDRSLSLQEFASNTGLPLAGAERLARAAASLRLLEIGSDGIALGPHGAALLGNPSVFGMVRHHALLYKDLQNPVALLHERTSSTNLAKYWNYGEGGSAGYSALMAETQAFIAAEVLNAWSFADRRRLIDVGGGAGAFVCAAARMYPELRATVFDLPRVVEAARQRFRTENIPADVVAGNFTQDALPKGADIITLIRVLHDHDDAVALRLLKSARAALDEGGQLLIAEPLAGTRGAERMGEAYFGFYLWAMGQGRPRSFDEIRAMLKEADFAHARSMPVRRPILTSVIVAR